MMNLENMLSERQEQILNLLIREYVDSAEPVSSQLLEKKHKIGVCPATLRIEMQRMTNEGYLSQPHTSAGRIPTDRGYRFIVDQLLGQKIAEEEKNDPKDLSDPWSEIEKEIEDSFRFIRLLAKKIAEETSNLTSAYLPEEEIVFKEGWSEALKDPEFENAGCLERFARIADDLENSIEELNGGKEIQVFIGGENPLPGAKDFSLIISRFSLPDEKKGFMAILGPKRMSYDKNISLINSLKKLLEDF